MNLLEKALFKTNAIKAAEGNKPFWYTSGTLGPYFINTHFLYGSEKDAQELLDFIDNNLSDKKSFISKIQEKVLSFYHTNPLFGEIIRFFYDEIKNIPSFKSADVISGGERRDWFFSIPVSFLSGKPHLYIFKDLDILDSHGNSVNLDGKKSAHIADLITEASSYKRAWIPAIQSRGGKIGFTAAIVDRLQGGREYLESEKIEMYASVQIETAFFKKALESGVIREDQFNLILNFMNDPEGYGRKFIELNPDFVKESLKSSDKSSRSKAERCVRENPYSIRFDQLGITF